MDRETVITHLQIIHTWASFARERDLQFFTAKHLEDIAQWTDDALELLKEQEAVEPKKTAYQRVDHTIACRYRCGTCDMSIFPSYKYCPFCGQAVKWE
jgi:rRNA maturation endonuclease Nob1